MVSVKDGGSRWWSHTCAAGLVVAATGVALAARSHLAATDVVMLYLLAIGVVAGLFGRAPALLASLLSVAGYDFFFVPPFHRFAVENERHLLTFAMMFGVGVVTSGLFQRLRRQEQEARGRERRTAALYALSRELGGAVTEDQVTAVITSKLVDAFGGSALLMTRSEPGRLSLAANAGPALVLRDPDLAAAHWAMEQGRSAGSGTGLLPQAEVLCVPAGTGVEVLAVLIVAPDTVPADHEVRTFVEAAGRQAALALSRVRYADHARTATLKAEGEEMRSSLLSAVSHDLRTPLAAILGAASTLRESSQVLQPTHRDELLDTICEETERMENLLRKLLDMSRLDSDATPIKKEWVPAEEVVGAALERLEHPLRGRHIHTDLPPELPLLAVDPVWMEQVFVNLLENVGRHTPSASALEVVGRRDGDSVVIEVSDQGPGVAAGDEERIFEKFVRGHQAGAGGAGLGLAICRSIVKAHAGTLQVRNRAGGGATFSVTLPVLVPPSSSPLASEPRSDLTGALP